LKSIQGIQESSEKNPKIDKEKEKSLNYLDKTSSKKEKSKLVYGKHKVSNHSKRKDLKNNLRPTNFADLFNRSDNEKLRKTQNKPIRNKGNKSHNLEKVATSNKTTETVIKSHILNLNKVTSKSTDSGQKTSNKGMRKIGNILLDLLKTREQ
jgi:hypothetical protein